MLKPQRVAIVGATFVLLLQAAALSAGPLLVKYGIDHGISKGDAGALNLAVVVYLTVGYPNRRSTGALLRAALDGGADVLELGVPFSDPLADGTTVQRASEGTPFANVLFIARRA